MIFPIVVVLVIALAIAVIVGVARNPGPSAADVAIGFELAWDRLDFAAVYQEFVAVKRAARGDGAHLGHVVEHVSVELLDEGKDAAVVVTKLMLRDGREIQNEVGLAYFDSWLVVSYALRPTPAR